jgi:hypothetical protein
VSNATNMNSKVRGEIIKIAAEFLMMGELEFLYLRV